MSTAADTNQPGPSEAPPAVEQPAAADASTVPPPGDEDFTVYKPPRTAVPSPGDLPDEYFTPTAADLKAAQAALHARTQALVNAPLQTRAIRDQREKARLERWPNTTIRIRFSDQTQLEKTFPSSNKIRAVYAFVRGSLREDVKPIKFILSQSPPLRDLKVSDPNVRDLTLAQLQLAPSSILLLRFEDPELNHSTVPAPLASTVLDKAVELPPPPTFDDTSKESTSASSSKPSTTQNSSRSAEPTGEKKIPKWLKHGKK